MLLAAMLAMVLVVAAPALAQDATAGDINTEIQFVDSDLIQAVAVEQFGGGAFASGDSSAAAVDNNLMVDQSVVSAGLDSTAAGDDVFLP